MQNVPLLISSLIRHADRHHGDVEIVSRRVEGDITARLTASCTAAQDGWRTSLTRWASIAPIVSRRWLGTVLRHYEGKVAKWQIPDDVVFVDAIPMGATGKMQKNKWREQFRGYPLPAR